MPVTPTVEDIARSEPLLAYWRDRGRIWAETEAKPDDVQRLLEIVRRNAGAPQAAASEFRKIWVDNMADIDSGVGWDFMGDRLPDEALYAFAEGATGFKA